MNRQNTAQASVRPTACCASGPQITMFRTIAAAFLVIALPAAARAERVESRPNPSTETVEAVTGAAEFQGFGSTPTLVYLSAIWPDLTSPIPGVPKNGVTAPLLSPLAASDLHWELVNQRYVARIRIVSENARRLRLHLWLPIDQPDLELRLQGNADPAPLGPITGAIAAANGIWLPITSGNTADLEVSFPGASKPEMADFVVDEVNIILVDGPVRSPTGVTKNNLGYAQYPEYDLTCFAGAPEYLALQNAAAATARISFIRSGSSYLCSGTLLNDQGNTRTPWFTTAHHCITDQSTANTIAFEWFFQSAACRSNQTDGRYSQTFGGAQLLWTDARLDASFLKLNNPPGTYTVFSGWDTDIRAGDPVWGVHHPRGDHTTVSVGSVVDLRQNVTDIGTGQNLILNVISFTKGGIEPGSSGSGLFEMTNYGESYWKGTVFGTVVNDYQVAYYSDFPSYYNNIKHWLGCCSPVGTSHYRLTVIKQGAASGQVYSDPPGIDCGTTCDGLFVAGRTVTLTATPTNGSQFGGWSGACSGTGACTVTMNSDQNVTASFTPNASGLYAAILPYARSVQVGQPATAFAALINATGADVNGCYLALPKDPALPISFQYQTTNTSNELTGSANTPVDIQAGATQNFVFGIAPTAAFAATDIPIVLACANAGPAVSHPGLNTFLLSASRTSVADPIAISATPTNDGIVHIAGTQAFATAAINIGATGAITASADTGAVALPLSLTLCQTNPASGACLSPPSNSTTATVNSNQTVTYTVFATALSPIPFDPVMNRIYLRLASGGVTRGATSVAVTTQ